ncbi:MAG: cyclopropane-fatty-acyl-phospholipid synthase [Gallionellales bacterium 35-53-114]|jgi:cyclopropane-fatty-acyl-phospholipid synthase|nr:MAG: cyclopropane-fatty-acyl-phospholipid synthase [Gallionellales bacterium 35-53-114]OYZ62440.1 MAG: cyclopropane-fatty-acyl-phospholipid synthase [Gallionellales bacterium 24-53-125]OZB08500.1 MAG: cyclopropane-fatty-acyl-phospholipid synthase [Gallionellales bacterium 39-52-133]HQS59469.1 cyclopropane-fatty-acyl-phospholipid synthase family protein [Gallionellaceae bacterium]HQS76382.1 cyclopropane-fatty-acyl-phospholipid synthase family protein [Gallionellaceae bacterium]
MRQEQVRASGKSFRDGIGYMPSATENSSSFGNIVFSPEKMLLTRMMRAIGNPSIEIVLWNGQKISSHYGKEVAQVIIRDRGALLKLITDPELYFGEMYSAQRIDVQGDLLEFLDAIFRVWPLHPQGKNGKSFFSPLYDTRRNTLSGSRRNIQHHYDIGNEFYKLWLDERMLYTCAYFPEQNTSLEEAQLAKMDHVCRKLRLQPGEKVIEAGCGWGALALHMASHYGVSVQAYNISKEQISFARKRAQAEGLEGQVEFIEDDYRNVQGKFDAFVSVGMLEHVGVDNYQALGGVIDNCLGDNGRGLIHSIGLNFPRPMDAWTERHIFPGANPPSLAQMMQIFEPYDFSVLDVENLRLHYAKTLEHWLQRYEENIDLVTDMFDQEFARAWRLYLAGSHTAFKTGRMQLFQVLFNRAGNNQIPATRRYQYASDTGQVRQL